MGRLDPLPARRVRNTVLVLSAANAGLAALLVAAPGAAWGHLPGAKLLVFAVAFLAVGRLRFNLDFSQQRVVFTLTEAVLVVALFNLPSPWIGLVVGLAEISRCILNRASPLKVSFNGISQMATALAAASVFGAVKGVDPRGVGLWLAALAGVGCWSTLNTASVSVIVGRAERRSFEQTLLSSVPTAVSTTVLGTALGLVVEELSTQGPEYLLLVAPVGLGVWLNARHAAAQRSEHLRVERLYEATTRAAQLAAEGEAPAVVAQEARDLITGQAAVCLVRGESGGWSGHVSSGEGATEADQAVVGALLGCRVPPGESLETVSIPPALRDLAPGADTAVLARSPEGSDCDLLVGVLRRTGAKKGVDRGLGDTLGAYVAHGAVTAANTALVRKLHGALKAQTLANQRKDEFVATISHELRTPLTVVLGSVETLQRLQGRIEPADTDRLLRTASDQGQRLRLLIEDLLLVAAAEQGKLHCDMVPVPASQLVEDLWADLPVTLRDWVHIGRPAPDLSALSDRFKLRQVISNLVQNAAKYAPGSSIEIGFERRDDRLYVSVADHGPGIPEDQRHRVFERFVQLDQGSTRSTGGTGLGLFICAKLAEQMQATLELTGTEGGGCTFTLGLLSPGQPSVAVAGAGTAGSRLASQGLLARPDMAQGLLSRPDMAQLALAQS